MSEVVIAHAGGWDELLMLVGSALVAVWFLRRADRRFRERTDEERSEAQTGEADRDDS